MTTRHQQFFQEAKKEGYSDEEITNHLLETDPSFGQFLNQAQQEGYSPEEVLGHFNAAPTQNTDDRSKKSLTQGAYDILKESEDTEREIERNIARGTSRMVERTLGAPGDIIGFLQSFFNEENRKENPFPTSASLQEKSEKLTLGHTSPKTEFEKKGDEFLGDVASSMLPGGPAYSLARNIGIPLAGALAKEGIQSATGDEKKGNWGKLATMFMLDLIANRRAMVPRRPGIRGAADMGGPQSYVNSLFQRAEASLPANGQMIDATQLQLGLNNLRAVLNRGGTRQSRARALQVIDELEARIQNGQIDIRELPEFRTRINEDIHLLGGWDFQTPPAVRERAVQNLTDVKRQVIQAGEDYGRTQNPEFLTNWRNANEAQSVLSRSNVVSNFIQRTIGDSVISKGIKSLFGIGGATAAAHKLGTTGMITSGIAGGVAGGIYGAAKTLYRIIRSPTLREYYFNTVNAALNGQKGVLLKNITALDEKMKEEDKKESSQNKPSVKKQS
jgi:hypothetical protein